MIPERRPLQRCAHDLAAPRALPRTTPRPLVEPPLRLEACSAAAVRRFARVARAVGSTGMRRREGLSASACVRDSIRCAERSVVGGVEERVGGVGERVGGCGNGCWKPMPVLNMLTSGEESSDGCYPGIDHSRRILLLIPFDFLQRPTMIS
ncbi:hypothetical protein K402DRAFT_241088 [Aulographum hederae CBS 113979]|uniref:Uncharacterized protein n=1 Tax=Aulographum hederae CBS 113979 TaxID=1176131 RepID=A0A6G1GK58_9PEZI|nr:hypothetical protein K402DRAFT_241088 [Aulographum hederae CBS 113979]